MSILALSWLAFVLSCANTNASEPVFAESSVTPSRAAEPRKVCQMPEELFEISGLTDIDATTLACIQDEDGELYFYDVENCRVTETVTFAGAGDFEGVTRAGETMYVLRSDGTLYELTDLQAEAARVRKIETGVPAGDNEGLAYDPRTQQLLIAPKAKYDDEDFEKDFRAVYAFDLGSGEMAAEPFLQLRIKDIEQFLAQQSGLDLPRKKKNDEIDLKFEFSGLAVHPRNDRVYLLLGPDGLLLTVQRDGRPVAARSLDKDLLPQPEGITLLDDHTLVLSSEGKKDGTGMIALFEAL